MDLGDWTWEKLKEEVDRGYHEFFARRNMDPTDRDFLYGTKSRASNPQSSSSENDQPTEQSSPEKNQNPS